MVIKLGGSLMHSKELPMWLKSIEEVSKNSNIVIVPGGGEFADKVRETQTLFKFDDLHAHRMALLAMSQFGYLLSGLNSKIQLVDDISALSANLGKELPLLWQPKALLNDFTEVPASWDYTSDSISLWLARKLTASRLILVKSRTIDDNESALKDLANKGLLDKAFQEFMEQYNGEVLWFEKSQYQQLHQVLTSQTSRQVIKTLN